jgi:hypothetical protein
MASDREVKPASSRVHPPANLAILRGQLAIVRTLLDEFERLLSRRHSDDDDGPLSAAEQLHEELARLSHQMRQMTEAFPESVRPPVVPVADGSGPRPVDIRRTA